MRSKSLAFRLALIAALGSTLALILAGTLFVFLFRSAVERSFDERLDALLKTLVATAVNTDGIDPIAAHAMGEPRFALPQSGWYWQIRSLDTGTVVAASPSLIGDTLPVDDLPARDQPARTLEIAGSDGKDLRALERRVDTGSGGGYAVLVSGDTDDLDQEIADFRLVVVISIGLFAALLAIGTSLLVRWGLWPLRAMRDDLGRVRRGEISQFEGDFPREIEPLVAELNALLISNREIVDRARRHVGNLAHALKTPLAVLQNEAASSTTPLAARVRDQVAVMRDQVGHHLDRARIAAQSRVIGVVTPVPPVVESLARVMRKVHEERDLAIETHATEGLSFRGEKQDLEEMVGNLFDNACKWARSRVRVTVDEFGSGRENWVRLTFEDDGPGLAADQRQAALSRGMRLDESKPGSGLGLSIVVELARIYRGRLTLEDTELGGLSARLFLPAADRDL